MIGRVARCALAIAAAGCSAPEVCQESELDGQGITLTSVVGSGSNLMSQGGDVVRLRFEAELSGLPELWQFESAILGSSLTVEMTMSYESAPFGADGQTEMPRVELAALRALGTSSLTTPRFPRPKGSALRTSLLETCLNEGDPGCCPFGSRECTIPFTVLFRRIDGAPFPPIVVKHAITADARVSTCPLGEGNPSLAVRAVE